MGICAALPRTLETSTGATRLAARVHGRMSAVAAVLLLSLAACGAPAPAPSAVPPTAAPPAKAAATPVATMRPEAATYWRQYCAAVAAWDRALDAAVAWSSRTRLDRAAGREPDPDTAAAIEDMRTEIAAIATFPPVLPISRALEKAAVRMERVVGLLGPVVGGSTGTLDRARAATASPVGGHGLGGRVPPGRRGQLRSAGLPGSRARTCRDARRHRVNGPARRLAPVRAIG